jgi:hypothetical protein
MARRGAEGGSRKADIGCSPGDTRYPEPGLVPMELQGHSTPKRLPLLRTASLIAPRHTVIRLEHPARWGSIGGAPVQGARLP